MSMQHQIVSTIKDFEVLKKIGDGSFAQVFKVYALKKVKMNKLSQKEKENALNEVRLLASLENDYIVSYKDAFYEEAQGSLCLVMELLEGGSLQDCIDHRAKTKQHFTEEQAWHFVANMVLGLKGLHDKQIMHRDIKCANVFMKEDWSMLKLGDMNVSKQNKGGFLRTQTGTPYYASPEVWKDLPYNHKSDIWSLGCVFYEMLAYHPPFMANDMAGLYDRVQRALFRRIPGHYSDELNGLIVKCLQKNPNARASVDSLLEIPQIQRAISKMNRPRKTLQVLTENSPLLETIKVPRSMKGLKSVLPKNRYDTPNKENMPCPSILSNNSIATRDSLPRIVNKQFNRYIKHKGASHEKGARLDSVEHTPQVLKTPLIMNNKSSGVNGQRVNSLSSQRKAQLIH